MRVVVVGAGVIGAATALELSRRGAEVTILDRGEIASGCSHGNAGWLTPCFATPLPAPGVLTKSLRWLLDPESPLYVHPSLRPDRVRWLFRFAASTMPGRYARGVEALSALSTWSLEAWRTLDREYPGSFGFTPRGLLLVAETQSGLRHAVHEAEAMGRFGVPHRVLASDGVRELEPAVVGKVAGGVFFESEAHCEPAEAVRVLARAATDAGAAVVTRAEVYGFDVRHGRLRAVRTTRGEFEADRFVVAAGSWSKDLTRALGVRVPVLGGKGYAVVVRPFDPGPTRPIKILERRIAITPREGSVRLAGTLELVDGDERISPRRVEAIVRGARALLPVPDPPEVVDLWRGLRPCTPDGLPIIGVAPAVPNLLVATGHQMCGLHTAPATGRLAADLVLGETPTFDPAPFRVERF